MAVKHIPFFLHAEAGDYEVFVVPKSVCAKLILTPVELPPGLVLRPEAGNHASPRTPRRARSETRNRRNRKLAARAEAGTR